MEKRASLPCLDLPRLKQDETSRVILGDWVQNPTLPLLVVDWRVDEPARYKINVVT